MHLFISGHLETVCPSCRTPHKQEWRSEWNHHDHYLTTDCNCGYKVHFKTEHFHSGHHD